MHKVELQNLYKIFFPSQLALNMALADADPQEIRRKTGGILAVINANLTINSGEIFVIMGLSGSGKSTLIRCINRLIEPSHGNVLIDGVNSTILSTSDLRDLRRHRVSMVFQNFALLPHKNVLENVEYGLALRKDEKAKRREKTLEMLSLVGLADWAEHYPDNLSGGMKQRVGLARALATDSEILIMDEPFSALDPLIRRDLQDELIKLQQHLKKTIIFVTHDFHEAIRIGNRIAIMRHGKVVQSGSPQDIVFYPADEYVKRFSSDIDRSKIVKVSDIMQGVNAVNPTEAGGVSIHAHQSVAEVFPFLSSTNVIRVLDNEGKICGALTLPDILNFLASGQIQDSLNFQQPVTEALTA